MQSIPNTLYHATYCAYIDSILTHGLGAKPIPNWEFSKPNVVYLEACPDAAESYPEISEIVSDDIYELGIVILRINTSNLDMEKLQRDSNIRYDEHSNSFEYHGIIPASNLHIMLEDT